MNASRYDYMHADDHHGHSHGRARSAFDRGAINNWYAPHHDSSQTGRFIAHPLLRWVATRSAPCSIEFWTENSAAMNQWYTLYDLPASVGHGHDHSHV